MKMTRTLVAALVLSTVMAAPAMAAKNTNNVIAPEALSTAESAPAGFDPAKKDAASTEALIRTEANPIIVIDPGHGGSDPGAVGNGLRESDIVLDIANRTRSYIVANYPATVYQTRTSDTFVSLADRATFSNNKGANIFVSQHINSYSTTSPNGLEVYAYPNSTTSLNLSNSIYNKLKASYSTLRGVKTATYYVLTYTYAPASLGETGFISNPTDAANLGSSTFRQKLATQYAQGMHVYWWGY